MNNWIKCPLQLARTRQGEIVLHTDTEFQYAFTFGSLHRLLTAEQFHLLHNSALSSESAPLTALLFTLFGSLSRSELLELKNLLGKAALVVTTLSRAYHHVN